jgi:hypothetical protein
MTVMLQNTITLITGLMIGLCGCAGSLQLPPPQSGASYVVTYQPSHQMDTGENFNEAEVCNAIAGGAIAAASPSL